MHAVAHEGCTDTVRESALEKESLAAPGNQTCVSGVLSDALETGLRPRPKGGRDEFIFPLRTEREEERECELVS